MGPADIGLNARDLPPHVLTAELLFHVVTAYNILRTRGVPIGKGDYEGQLRIRPA
jgi:hypothetical protein